MLFNLLRFGERGIGGEQQISEKFFPSYVQRNVPSGRRRREKNLNLYHKQWLLIFLLAGPAQLIVPTKNDLPLLVMLSFFKNLFFQNS